MPSAPRTHLADCTATELSALYRRRQTSPLEALESVFARIDQQEPQLNAFVLQARETARASARESLKRWRAGAALGPLDGIPVTIKDLLLTRGLPTLRGSHTIDADQPWEVDSPAVARLREAGALIVGKTTTPEFGCKGETNSPRSGITRNPWNPRKTPGGSSGGAAAAVASGMGPIALGTDGAGSIRIPAAFCGCFGFKPSFGRVPAYPLSPFGTMAHVGPITMSVADATAVMNVIKQPDARDWTSLPPDHGNYLADLERGVRDLRVAWSPTLGYARNVDPEVADCVRHAVSTLQELGAHVEQVDPGIEDPLEITTGLWFVGAWTVWNALSLQQQALVDPDFKAEARLGRRFSAFEVQQLHLRRGALGSHMRQFMSRYDLLVTPAVAVPAFDAKPAGHTPMSPNAMLSWSPFSHPFNLTQQPACTIPCGLTSQGLPVGLQLVGPMFEDALVLRAARAFEQARPLQRPALAAA